MYEQDGLKSIHNCDFLEDPSFINAYERGIAAAGQDYCWHWRVHIGLWAARSAIKLDGDFVECGVNAGFLSSSIMHDLEWDQHNKIFYLLDTFNGLDERYVSEAELKDGILDKNKKLIKDGFYVTSSKLVKENFSEWENVHIIEGSIPDTLTKITTNKIAFAHIDLNCAHPEVEALDYLWNKLVTGALVLLDDYAYYGYRHQKCAIDNFSVEKGFYVATLPTGQGLLIKT
ncbi:MULTISPECIES: TylF/MycF/NovP-related O-methyltransferase [unclassified Endozoicomonas]|uniref:TylF/MycF/NovP-related O-methyltransferase n=1 Tax=unclassified Endozoicomonas TaxID=2644528 RepID=UPI003BB072C0